MASVKSSLGVSVEALPAIPASSLKSTTVADKKLTKQVSLTAQNTTGAGITYTETAKCLLTFLSLQSRTANDTKYRLTIDGIIVAQEITTPIISGGAGGNNILALDGTGQTYLPIPLLCPNGFTLFVQSIADTSIDVYYTIVELA